MISICILLIAGLGDVQFRNLTEPEIIIEPDDNQIRLSSSQPTADKEQELTVFEKEEQSLEPRDFYENIDSTKDNPVGVSHKRLDIPIPQNIEEIKINEILPQEPRPEIITGKKSNYKPPYNSGLVQEKETPEIQEKTCAQPKKDILYGYFTENKGHVGNDSVRYYIQGGGVWFLDDGVVIEQREYVENRGQGSEAGGQGGELLMDPMTRFEPVEYRSVVLKLEFSGANLVIPKGVNKLSWNNNYFYGNDSTKWCTDVANFREIFYENLYENIDLRYYLTSIGLKYDFIVHPDGNPEDIRITVDGANGLLVDDNRNLKIKTKFGEISDSNLYIYQEFENNEDIIEGNFKILDSKTYSFEILSEYNQDIDLIIDPVIYSTCIGGNTADIGHQIIVNSSENAIVAGYTNSINFPITSGLNYSSYITWDDIFILQLNHNGSKLIYSTFIGGSVIDIPMDIATDNMGNIFLTGQTFSQDFPVTSNAYQNSSKGGGSDGFILKLSSNGSTLIFSTYITGSGWDYCHGLALDSGINPVVFGTTSSTDLPTTSGAYDTSHNGGYYDAFVLKLNQTGSKLIYSTFIGGSNRDYGVGIEIVSTGNVIVMGYTASSDFPITSGVYDTSFNGITDIFILSLNQSGSKLLFSTFLGGTNYDVAFGITTNMTGYIFITGNTYSLDFPTTSGAFNTSYSGGYDIFVTKLNPSASKLSYSTYIGGKNDEFPCDIALNKEGYVFITGSTSSIDFPTTPDAFGKALNKNFDVIFFKLDPSGSLLNYSTFIGGKDFEVGYGLTMDLQNNVYITGYTNSSDFPTTPDAYDTTFNKNGSLDCFAFKLGIKKINHPPIISSFTATTAPEGSKVIFTVNATDPENDDLTYSFDFQGDYIFDYVGKNDTVSYLWGDDYTGIAKVLVSDGIQSAESNTSVIVNNSKPILKSINIMNVTKVSQTASREWIVNYSSPTYGGGVADAIVADSYGSVYITGHLAGNNTGEDYVTIKYDTYGTKLWENRYSGPGNNNDWPYGIAVDLAGNVFITGRSPGNGTNHDFATVAYDPNGNELWVARYNGPENGIDIAYAITIGPSGNIYVTGECLGNGTFSNCTTIAYDQNGKELWIRKYNNSKVDDSAGLEIDSDGEGNIYVAGFCIYNKTNYDYITIKYDSKGNELWQKRYNGPGNSFDYIFGLKVSKIGNVYITGRSEGNGTGADYATIKYDTNGTRQWINRYNGLGNALDLARGIDIDPNENVYVTGYSDSGTDHDFVTIAYNSTGDKLWLNRYNGPGNGHDNAYAIVVDSLGNVYITGQSFGNGTSYDFATIAYNAEGEQLWVERYDGGTKNEEGGFRITIDSLENVYVAGYRIRKVNGVWADYLTIKYSTLKSYECDEGTSLTITAMAFDRGSDDLNFTWDLGDGFRALTTVYYNNNNPDPYPSPDGIYPFNIMDKINHTYGDDGNYFVKLNVSDDDGGKLTYKFKIIVNNVAPQIEPFGPFILIEGDSYNFSANVSDVGSDDLEFNWTIENGPDFSNLYYNDDIGPDPYPSPKGTYPFSVNDSINYTFPDNGIFNVTLTVTDDDGLNSTYLTRIILTNVAPKVNLTVFLTDGRKKQTANLSVRIAGEKWHDVKVELYKNRKEITNGSIIRFPGSPNEQMLHFLNQTFDSSSDYSAILYYTPKNDPVNGKPNGATPCWVILTLSNGTQVKLHHTFKVKHKNTHIWRVNLTDVLPSIGNSTRNGTFNITVFDPGADNITLHLNFGDGTNFTKFYLNNNYTFPVNINLTLFHEYTSGGTFSVILIAKDDDGGITTINVTIDAG
jgi:hypothetical protein